MSTKQLLKQKDAAGNTVHALMLSSEVPLASPSRGIMQRSL